MKMVDSAWLIHPRKQSDLVDQATRAARSYEVALQPLLLDDFLAEVPRYVSLRPHIVALLESGELGPLMHNAYLHGATMGLLPVHPKSKVCTLFRIPPKLEDAMPLALRGEGGCSLDLLLCNEEVAIGMVTLGDIPFVELRQIGYQHHTLLQGIRVIFRHIPALFGLQTRPISISISKDVRYTTAVLGIVVIENDTESLTARLVNESTSNLDGKLSAILISPLSILNYLQFLVAAFLSKARPAGRLPSAVSYIKTAQIVLDSRQELHYSIDGRPLRSAHIVLRVVPEAVSVNVGPGYREAHQPTEDGKDVMRVQSLPQGEDYLHRLTERLPLFSTAREDDFEDVFVALRDYAHLSASFNLLVVLSTVLATLGLFLNNAPVVIGAMLMAPLMGPVISLAMSILRNDRKLLRQALRVLVSGTLLTVLIAAMTTAMLPYQQITEEIQARMQPNLLDLGVAIVSGIAAAYAHARENVHKSLPGVAIAVALVPPACVVGIGAAWLDWHVIGGAALLFLANLAGITLAGAVAFLCLGFSTVLKVNRGVGFSLLLTALISVPLYYSFENTIVYQRMSAVVTGQTYRVRGKAMQLTAVSLRPAGQKIKVLAEVHSRQPIEAEDVAALRDSIAEQLGQPVLLDASLRLVQ